MKTVLALEVSLLVSLLTLSHPASADSTGGAHLISVGAGISSPSGTTSLTENPAGLIYNQGFTTQFSGSSENKPPSDPWDLGFGGFMGNGTVGGALKVDDMVNGTRRNSSSGSSSSSLEGGLGVDFNSLNSAVGTSCGTSLGSTVSVSCSNFGWIYAPTNSPRLGVQVVTSPGPTEYGAGVAGEVGSNATLALDASTTTQGGGVGFKPGIGFNLQPIQFAVGDGFGTENGTNTGLIRTGFSAAIGVSASQTVQLEAYYDQIAEFYFALDVRF